MGKIFKLIADEALKPLDDYYKECHVCNQKNVPLYPYQGNLISDKDFDVYAVCEKCINDGNSIESINEDEINPIIDKFCNDPEKSKHLLRKTPNIPLFLQYRDWPVHCGELCEFIGIPKTYDESVEIGNSVLFWDRGESDYNGAYGDITLEPEALSEVSVFKCTKCGKKLFTWQMT
jgi:uncharacterized protein CbrC (UPF0167 family)